ncbi:tryptophan--tRNA ligase, partial [bacterium]|nr:tryptophan--tRNA ligase [bacterium]
MKQRIFSGIQPSGDLHIGNYLGAIKNWVSLQDTHDNIFCIVDLHAITVPQDPNILKKRILEVANVYLAAGIDPKKSTIFVQSDRPEHSELAWILNTITYMGEMKRMTQFKDKAGDKQDNVSVGLFDYPVLMAADIVLYNANLVPVGKDQFQHIELTRDIAERFNKKFGKTFVMPEAYSTKETVNIMGLDDPTKKMAKSAKTEFNFIALKDTEEVIRKKIARAVTDSGQEIKSGVDKPALTNLLNIYSAFSNKTVTDLEKEFKGKSYKDLKDGLTETVLGFILPFQKKLSELEKNPDYTLKILKDGAKKLEPIGKETLARVKKAVGLG